MRIDLTPEQAQQYEVFYRWKRAWGSEAAYEADSTGRWATRNHRSAASLGGHDSVRGWQVVEQAIREGERWRGNAGRFYREVIEQLHDAIHEAETPERWAWAMGVSEEVMRTYPSPSSPGA